MIKDLKKFKTNLFILFTLILTLTNINIVHKDQSLRGFLFKLTLNGNGSETEIKDKIFNVNISHNFVV